MLPQLDYILKTLQITMGHLQQFVGDPLAVLTNPTDFLAGIDFLQVSTYLSSKSTSKICNKYEINWADLADVAWILWLLILFSQQKQKHKLKFLYIVGSALKIYQT